MVHDAHNRQSPVWACLASRLILCLALSLGGLAQAQWPGPAAREEVTSLKPLLIRAIEQGRAAGVMVGPVAEGMARVFVSTAPIEVDVERLAWLQESGCARLQVSTNQAAVVMPEPPTAVGVPTPSPTPRQAAPDSPQLTGLPPGQRPAQRLPQPQALRYALSYCQSGTFPEQALALKPEAGQAQPKLSPASPR